MSVRMFSKKEIGRIGRTILAMPRIKETIITPQERVYMDNMGCCDIDREVKLFCRRLYVANQVAYYYQYPDEIDNFILELMDDEDFKDVGVLMSARELALELMNLKYNLYTNNGRCFLGREDMERLERAIVACLREVAGL